MNKLKIIQGKQDFILAINGQRIHNIVSYKVESDENNIATVTLVLAYGPDDVEVDVKL